MKQRRLQSNATQVWRNIVDQRREVHAPLAILATTIINHPMYRHIKMASLMDYAYAKPDTTNLYVQRQQKINALEYILQLLNAMQQAS